MATYEELTQSASRLGEKFVSVDEAGTLAGCAYESRALFMLVRGLETVPMELCIEKGYTLLPGPAEPCSLRTLQKLRRKELFPDLEVPWYEKQGFVDEELVLTQWYVIRTVPVPNTLEKSFADQREMLDSMEVVPTVVELLWAMSMLRALRGMYMLPGHLARTASVGRDGNPVVVGVYGEQGVFIHDRYPADKAVPDVGIISRLVL